MEDIEPLEPSLWLLAIGRLVDRLTAPLASEEERLIRQAFHLLQLAPRPLRGTLRTECDEKSFERMLDAADYRSAALALLHPPLIYSLTDGRDGIFEAQVHLPGRGERRTARSASAAAALTSAWVQCVAGLCRGSTSP